MTTVTQETISTVIREFDNPLVYMAGVTSADSELARYGDGFQIVTLAEHRLHASHKTVIHRQTLDALHAGRVDPETFIREHIADAHFKTFGEALRRAVEASGVAWHEIIQAFNDGRPFNG